MHVNQSHSYGLVMVPKQLVTPSVTTPVTTPTTKPITTHVTTPVTTPVTIPPTQPVTSPATPPITIPATRPVTTLNTSAMQNYTVFPKRFCMCMCKHHSPIWATTIIIGQNHVGHVDHKVQLGPCVHVWWQLTKLFWRN